MSAVVREATVPDSVVTAMEEAARYPVGAPAALRERGEIAFRQARVAVRDLLQAVNELREIEAEMDRDRPHFVDLRDDAVGEAWARDIGVTSIYAVLGVAQRAVDMHRVEQHWREPIEAQRRLWTELRERRRRLERRLTPDEQAGQRRYPLQPLLDAACATVGDVAATTGFDRRTVASWAQAGICETYADRCAVALGVHPSAVWDDWWEPTS